MKKLFITLSICALNSYLLLFCLVSNSIADDKKRINIVGSSTIFPFAAKVSEEFGKKTKFRSPIVESNGTGGGLKIFCSGSDKKTPSISMASRKIKPSEIKLCKSNGVKKPTEIFIGYDGIVIATAKESKIYKITRDILFQALAKKIYISDKFIKNPYKKWSDIDKSLPDTRILVYGPPPTSGTRDAFADLVMYKICKKKKEFKLKYTDSKFYKLACKSIREDGAYVESGEDDNVIVRKLTNNPSAIGIFGYSFLENNSDKLHAIPVDGVKPEFENITSQKYSIARSLFLYVKNEHVAKNTSIKAYLEEFMSDEAISDIGYLAGKGFIPAKDSDIKKTSKKISDLK